MCGTVIDSSERPEDVCLQQKIRAKAMRRIAVLEKNMYWRFGRWTHLLPDPLISQEGHR
jgi:hypothetical protein